MYHHTSYIPKGKARRFAIGDIHGCFYTLEALLHKQLNIKREDQVFLLGDYINRGFYSAKVLDHFMALRAEKYNLYCIRGNHEMMFLDFSKSSKQRFESFLASYHSQDLVNENFEAYFNFCLKLNYYLETEDYYFVHAAINFKAENPWESYRKMCWAMKPNTSDDPHLQHKKLLHGHFSLPESEIRASIQNASQVIGLDNGCSYKQEHGRGRLCALDLDTLELYFQDNLDFETYTANT